MALFTAGFFAEALQHRAVGLDYYVNMGGGAYRTLASDGRGTTRSAALVEVFAELAAKFLDLVDALNDVRASARGASDHDLLRLYETWLRTGSRRAGRLLRQAGVQPGTPGPHWTTSTEPTGMLLRDLQCLLGTLYGIDVDADVRDYLVTDAAALREWEDGDTARDTDEKLLIEQGDGELAMALYLDGAVLDRLDAHDPREHLCGRNLTDFCLALEGVSHFNYVAWNAAMDKTVTLLELEMQAEIDKYVSARILLGQQDGERRSAAWLLDSLFDSPAFDEALSAEELRRYQDASSLAGRYCHSLECRFPSGPAAGAPCCANCAPSSAGRSPPR